MKLCATCGSIFCNDSLETCSYCQSKLSKIKNMKIKDGKFEGEYETEDKDDTIYIIKSIGFKKINNDSRKVRL